MNTLSETTKRKFIETKNVSDYEILTDTGWKDVSSIGKTVPYEVWEIKTETHSLKCADTHIVFNENMEEIFVKDLQIGQKIATENGFEKVLSVENLHFEDNMYDITVDDGNHRYYSDGILSHNSTMYCIYTLWNTCFFQDKKILILANKASTALELMSRIERAYQELPNWLKPSVLVYNKGEMVFGNNSGIRALASSSDQARGFSANCAIIDEAAFLPKSVADKLFTSVIPTVSSSKNGKIIIVSTPNGMGNLFYDIWQKANQKNQSENQEGWKPFTMWWWQIPGRDEKWKAQQIASMGKEKFAQEFNNEFLAGSTFRKLIPDDIIEKYRMTLDHFKHQQIYQGKMMNIVSESNEKVYNFKVWHEFEEGHSYIASGDVSEGIGNDYSVLYVWDVTDLSKITMCAKFAENNISMNEFAFVSSKMLTLYGNPYYICESNGIGVAYLDILKNTYEYPNLVYEDSKDNSRPGVRSHAQIKSRACLWLREMFTTKGFGWVIYDSDLIDEMTTFIEKDKKVHTTFAAISNAHDDLIMALCWAAYVLQPDVIEKYLIITSTFRTDLNQIYAKTTQPLEDLSQNDLTKIYEDPLYLKFLEYKEEAEERLRTVMELEHEEFKNDIFSKYELVGLNNLVELRKLKNMRQNSYKYRNSYFIVDGNTDAMESSWIFGNSDENEKTW